MRAPAFLLATVLVLAPAEALAAGNVIAELKGSKLTIEGDEQGNSVSIDGSALPDASLRIQVSAGTTVNGNTDPLVFDGVESLVVDDEGGDNSMALSNCTLDKTVSITLGDGVDTLNIEDATVRGKVTLKLGEGGNTTFVTNASDFLDKLTYTGGDGNDSLHVQASSDVDGDIKVTGGDGLNAVTFDTAILGGKLTVKGGATVDNVNIVGSNVAGKVKLTLDDGDANTVVLEEGVLLEDDLEITGGDGVNNFNVRSGVQIGGDVKLTAGDGDNNLSLEDFVPIAGKLTVKGGDVENELELVDVSITGKVKVTFGDAPNHLLLDDLAFIGGDGLDYKGGDGADTIDIVNGGRVVGKTKLTLGDGDNFLDMTEGATENDLTYKGGDNGDTVLFSGTDISFGGSVTLTLGDGFNVVNGDAMDDPSTIAGDLTVKGGDDTDTVDLGGTTVDGEFDLDLGDGADPAPVPPL
jgi:hypothetical protein